MRGLLEVKGAEVRHGRKVAVQDVTFRVEPGTIVGLLGRNGAGKSSLMAAIAGFHPLAAGQVTVDGQPVFENPARTPMVCLVRDTVDAEDARLGDALEAAGQLRPFWNRDLALRLVKAFGLDLGANPHRMSRGQRCAVGAVIGLASRAPLTLLDETVIGMDAPNRHVMAELMLEDYLEHPRTIIISTHLISEIERLFGQVLVLHGGRLISDSDADTFREEAGGSVHDRFISLTTGAEVRS